MSAQSVPVLLERARREKALSFPLTVSAGLTRDQSALRALRKRGPQDRSLSARVAYASALLALGDGTFTGTISSALEDGPTAVRLQLAKALAQMRATRPKRLLYRALSDQDDLVRLHAAKTLSTWSSRANRALVGLLDASPRIQRRAARALEARGGKIPVHQIGRLPFSERSRALAREAARDRNAILRKLKRDVDSKSADDRVAAFAGLAASGERASSLERMAERAQKKVAESLRAESEMARALVGDEAALAKLSSFSAAEAQRAAEVVWAFAGAGERYVSLEPEPAARLARAFEGWIVTRKLDERSASRLLRALEVLDADAGLTLARARLLGPDGWSFRTAARVLGRRAEPPAVKALVQAAGRVKAERSRAEALRAAYRICFR